MRRRAAGENRVRARRWPIALLVSCLAASACAPSDWRGEAAQAVGELRLVEPRLSLPLPAGLCELEQLESEASVPRARCAPFPDFGTPAFEALTALPERVGRLAPASEQEAATGTVTLLLHAVLPDAVEQSIRILEGVVASSGASAAVLTDLGAAYFVRASKSGGPLDLVRALDRTERALRQSPDEPAASYNLALILERLHLASAADLAWDRYLTVDPDSPWSDEVRARRDRRGQAPEGETGATGTELAPETARLWVMDRLLAEWAAGVAAGDAAAASGALLEAEELADALTDRSAAGSLAAVVSAGPETLPELVQGHLLYAEGREAYERLDNAEGLRVLEAAAARLARAGSPAAGWAEMWAAAAKLRMADLDAAAVDFARVLSAAPTDQPALRGRAHWGLALIAIRRSAFARSLAHYDSAAVAFEVAGEAERLGAVEDRAAEVLLSLGRPDEAWERTYLAARRLSATPRSLYHESLLRGMADAAEATGLGWAALWFEAESLALSRRLDRPGRIAQAHLWRSRTRLSLADTAGAEADLVEAGRYASDVTVADEAEFLRLAILDAEGRLLTTTNPGEAVRRFDEVIEARARAGITLTMLDPLVARARAYRMLDERSAAEADFARAIELVEGSSRGLESGFDLAAYRGGVRTLFDELVDFHIAVTADTARALEFAERSRLTLWPRATAEPRAVEARALSATLPEDVAIVSYAWTRLGVHQWLTTRAEGSTLVATLDAAEVSQGVDRLLEAMTAPHEPDAWVEPGQKLRALLVPERVGDLPGDVRLVFVPDRRLRAVPFAALPDSISGDPLIVERSVSVVPDLSFVGRAGAGATVPRGAALLVGDPAFATHEGGDRMRLRGAEVEARALVEFYPGSSVLSGATATHGRIVERLDRFPVLHYAGHAVSNPDRPEYSHLLLAPDEEGGAGALYAHELDGMRFETLRMVVLSACESIVATAEDTGGLWGVAHPFVSGGVPAVVGTLWSVDDRLTPAVVTAFHRRWAAGASAADALRGAQLDLIESDDPDRRHPYVWAAFQLIGNTD